MNSIPWKVDVIEETLPDGTPVKALCWHWSKDVNVEMISPYPGKRDGRHLMYIIPKSFEEGGWWRRLARSLIEGLVERGRKNESNPIGLKAEGRG